MFIPPARPNPALPYPSPPPGCTSAASNPPSMILSVPSTTDIASAIRRTPSASVARGTFHASVPFLEAQRQQHPPGRRCRTRPVGTSDFPMRSRLYLDPCGRSRMLRRYLDSSLAEAMPLPRRATSSRRICMHDHATGVDDVPHPRTTRRRRPDDPTRGGGRGASPAAPRRRPK